MAFTNNFVTSRKASGTEQRWDQTRIEQHKFLGREFGALIPTRLCCQLYRISAIERVSFIAYWVSVLTEV